MNKDCVSLEVAKKLQAVGYISECNNVYISNLSGGYSLEYIEKGYEPVGGREPHEDINIPAPTTTQLAEELPKKRGGSEYLVITPNSDGGWCCGYQHYDTMTIMEAAATLPDALGLMMVYLLENGLIIKK